MNDDVDERVQSFALVGKLGDDVPEDFACFQITQNDRECSGRTGATTINIEDNDGKAYMYFLVPECILYSRL